jgi:hypothetical protein
MKLDKLADAAPMCESSVQRQEPASTREFSQNNSLLEVK